jgi:hypothetical protein
MADKNICRTKRLSYSRVRHPAHDWMVPMIDRTMMETELNQARLARQDAEAAITDVEDMIWELQHVQLGRQRLVFSIAGFEQEPEAA